VSFYAIVLAQPPLTELGLGTLEIEMIIQMLSILEQERAIVLEGIQDKVHIAHPLAQQTRGLLNDGNLVEMTDVMTGVKNEETDDEKNGVKTSIPTFLLPVLATNSEAALLPSDADLEPLLPLETVQTSLQIAPGLHLVDTPLEETIVTGQGLH
jgi:hypothetical protein